MFHVSFCPIVIVFFFFRTKLNQIKSKDEPEGTQGSEVCHLDRVVLQQTWLCLASDSPSDACLKQSGSVDDFCQHPEARLKAGDNSRSNCVGEASHGTSIDGGEPRVGGGGSERRGSRQVQEYKNNVGVA